MALTLEPISDTTRAPPMHRRRSHVLLVLALFAPLPLTSSAYGQTAPTPSAPSAPAQPGATSPPPATAEPPHAPLIAPAPASADSGPSAPPTTSAPISPSRDQQDLAAQGSQRPEAGELAASGAQVFSEDWWAHARPVIDMHGYFRTRAELFHNLFLGRHNSSLNGNDPQYLWPIPLDQSYTSINGGIGQSTTANTVAQCGPATPVPTGACNDKTESGANVRLRLNPEIIISDNLRISTQIDLLDNVVLGSTPRFVGQPTGHLVDRRRHELAKHLTGHDGLPVGRLQRLRAGRVLCVDAGCADRRGQLVDQLDQCPACLGRVHDARRPGPVRSHAQSMGPRDGRQQRRRDR